MKIKFKLILSIMSLLIAFPLITIPLIYSRVTTLLDSTFQNNVTANNELGMSLINSKYPGNWKIQDNKLYKGDTLINDNFEVVDMIKKDTGAFATIFMNDTRVSTNVISDNGQRAVGTKASSAVIQKVLKDGKSYSGIAKVVGKNVLTYYEPIRDSSGQIIGMWFSGIEKTTVDSEITNIVTYIAVIMVVVLIIGLLVTLLISKIYQHH